MKNLLIILIVLVAAGCGDRIPEGYKLIKTDGFEIVIPQGWNYEKGKGIDSFIGKITASGVDLSFDMSDIGFANHLIPTEIEYINEEDWMPTKHPYMKIGVTYTTDDVEKTRNSIMEEEGIKDSSLVKVEKIYYPDKEILHQNGNYKAKLTYRDTIVYIDIKIPDEVKQHNFQLDTIGHLFRKIVTPKIDTTGMTGIYIGDLESPFNFNLVGKNLSKENKEEAVKAFLTIKFLK